MKIQQHDGVVVKATVISAGLRQAQGDGGGEGCAKQGVPLPSLSLTIYRGKGVEEAP